MRSSNSEWLKGYPPPARLRLRLRRATSPASGEVKRDGRLAENILYFARALRAAGMPVGPGAVLDALEALSVARVGNRDDFYWTLHAVFVKRHEHTILFDQAFRIFFRKRGYIDKLIAAMLPDTLPRRAESAAAGRAAHPGGAVLRPRPARAGGRGRARRAADRLRPRGAAEEGFRADERGRDRRRQGGDRAPGAADRPGAHAPPCRRAPRPADRHPPHAARQPQSRRRGDRPQISRARASRSRRSLRCWIFPAP